MTQHHQFLHLLSPKPGPYYVDIVWGGGDSHGIHTGGSACAVGPCDRIGYLNKITH